MKINLNFGLKDLDGKEIPKSNAGEIIANNLASSTGGDALKYWDWALKLKAGKDLDLDPSDFQTLKGFVENNQQINNLVKAQVLNVFISAK